MNRDRLIKLIENDLSNSALLLILNERQQDLTPIPLAAGGAPAQTEEEIVGFDHAVIEQLARIRCERVRHVGDGLLEARVKSPEPSVPDHLYYFDVGHIVRLVVQSTVLT